MTYTSFFKSAFLFCTILLFASCDKDFNEIGADVVGDDNFGFEVDSLSTVKAYNLAYNQGLQGVQTNNLPINALGYYNNPVFGKTIASFVTQLELAVTNPTIGENPSVLEVELTVPYFSRLVSTDLDGDNTYRLDSIYGASNIKLGIYASNYYLRDFDPESGFTQPQRYYSDQFDIFNSSLDDPQRLNNGSASDNDSFFFNDDELLTYETNDDDQQVVADRSAPALRMLLRKEYFQQKLFGAAAAGQLANNNVFKEYFRGLFFKVEPSDVSLEQGSLAMINFGQGKINIKYEVDGATAGSRVEKTMVLNLAGNTVNLFQNIYKPEYLAATANVDQVNGDERLYLKGGQGSLAVIELFGPDLDNNGVADELDEIRTKGWLINEANLTFQIDKNAMGTAPEPQRIYLYDLDNERPLIDYYTDVTATGNAKFNKTLHGGLIKRENIPGGRGVEYKIRITNHIRNLVKPDIDSTNVRLGLVVTESINTVANARLRTAVSPEIDKIPVASAMNQLGTVLYGTHPNVSAAKSVKLKIYYTKENE
jgi:hypothetical protein